MDGSSVSESTTLKHPRIFRLYYATVLVGTLALFAGTAHQLPTSAPIVLAVALLLMIVSEASPVTLPGGGYATATAVIDLACLIILGPVATASLDVASTLIIQGLFRQEFGSTGLPYAMPKALEGGQNLGFMYLPIYRAWVVVFSLAVCVATWFMIEKTKLGSYLRAATENPQLVQAFGINVPRMITITYGFGVGLAALAGVMAAPIYSVNPLMGEHLIIVVFAVVVIGGMGSIMGSIVTGFALGLVEGLTKVFYPEASNTVIFIVMAIVLMIRPSGLFGTQK